MPYNPTTIANYFIKKYGKEGELTPMKLLKLTYISYGWYLALTDGKEKLLNEQPVAWDLGPVFPSLYGNIKRHYDKWHIKKEIPNPTNEEINERDIPFLDKMWSLYGIHDGVFLSALTHEPGTPWEQVYCKGCNSILPDDMILEHYKSKIKAI